MVLRKKIRHQSKAQSKRELADETTTKTDLWLQRVSHISQFGLFLFMVGTIKFTVIPLYQKALLDEQIAEKEVELARLQLALRSAYIKIRSSVVNNYMLNAGAECSGLLIPPDPIGPTETKSEEKNSSEKLLSIEPEDCLTAELSRTALEELGDDDATYLQAEVTRIGSRLEQRRIYALARFENAEETAGEGPHSIPTTGFVGALADYFLVNQPPEIQQEILKRLAIDKERDDAATQYADEVRSELFAIGDIQWPSDESL